MTTTALCEGPAPPHSPDSPTTPCWDRKWGGGGEANVPLLPRICIDTLVGRGRESEGEKVPETRCGDGEGDWVKWGFGGESVK